MKLSKWEEEQIIESFRQLGISNPEKVVKEAFVDDLAQQRYERACVFFRERKLRFPNAEEDLALRIAAFGDEG